MTATTIKGGGAMSVGAVAPAAFKAYKERVLAAGGTIRNETDCANAFALAAKYGITSGVALSPDWGVRLMDGNVDKFFGLFGVDMANPFQPNSSGWKTFDLAVDSGHDSLHYSAIVQGYPSSDAFAVTTGLVSMIAVRSPTANTATEGYWLTMVPTGGTWYRFSVGNVPSAGSSQMRARVGTSAFKDALGAVKAGLNRWKVSGLHCDGSNIKAIEDGAVAATTAGTAGFFIATNYRVTLGFDANGTGGTNSRPVEAWFGEGWSVPSTDLAFALELAARMRTKYGEP